MLTMQKKCLLSYIRYIVKISGQSRGRAFIMIIFEITNFGEMAKMLSISSSKFKAAPFYRRQRA
jgi:hypothetical protein